MQERDISEFIDKIILIVDTNVLLYLYKCSFNTSQNLVQLMNKVKDKIIVPWQVYKEYSSHKEAEQAKIDKKYDNFTRELKTLVSNLQAKIEKSISQSRKYDFPNCDALENNIKNSVKNISDAIQQYGDSLYSEKQNKSTQKTNVEQLVNYLCTNNNIMEETSISEILDIIREGEIRFKYKMPPGYMDEGDKDKEWQKNPNLDNFYGRSRKFGDLFVWKEIIKIGTENIDKKIIFITNDVKEDWWDNNSQGAAMREELRKEFISITRNSSIEFLTLNQFYELFSKYYQIQDIKTQMEISIVEYAENFVLGERREEIIEYIKALCNELNVSEISEDFLACKSKEYEIWDLDIENTAIHFDEETAFYEITVEANIEGSFLDDGNILLGQAELIMSLNIEIQRDFLDSDEIGLEFKNASYQIFDVKSGWDVLLEYDELSRADVGDTYEDEQRH